MSTPNPQHTVILHEGVTDVYDAILEQLKDAAVAAENVNIDVPDELGYTVLADRREVATKLAESFFLAWTRLTVVNRRPEHDGDLHVFVDSSHKLSFGWRYDKSGYAGGLIFWPSDEQPMWGGQATGPAIPNGRWQTHT